MQNIIIPFLKHFWNIKNYFITTNLVFIKIYQLPMLLSTLFKMCKNHFDNNKYQCGIFIAI